MLCDKSQQVLPTQQKLGHFTAESDMQRLPAKINKVPVTPKKLRICIFERWVFFEENPLENSKNP